MKWFTYFVGNIDFVRGEILLNTWYRKLKWGGTKIGVERGVGSRFTSQGEISWQRPTIAYSLKGRMPFNVSEIE